MKKKALLSSILTIALCVSLIAGSTFALFTSENSVNIAVTSGKVDVVATVDGIELYTPKAISVDGTVTDDTNIADTVAGKFGNLGTAGINGNELTLTGMVPGDRATVTLKLINHSNVSVQYRTVIQLIGEDNSLLSALKITFGEGESAKIFNGNTVKSAWTAFDGTEQTVKAVIELPSTVGNGYQDKTCKLAFTVEAVQGNAEMPDEWDGTSTQVPTADPDGVYHITTAAEFVEYIKAIGATDSFASTARFDTAKVVLDRDIDLCGETIERIGEPYAFAGQFDGQNHTVSNFTIQRTDDALYTGLFGYFNGANASVKNLKIDHATVIGAAQTAVVVASVNGGTVENCHVSNSTVFGSKKVGSVVGYAVGDNGASAIVNDCTATNCNVYCAVSRDTLSVGKIQAGAVLGFANTGTITNITDASATNVNVYFDAAYIANGVMLNNGVYEIANAAGLQYVAATFNTSDTTRGKTFKLTNDIDLRGIAWTPWCNDQQYFCGTFDGNGKTIKNLTIVDDVDVNGHATGFIGRLGANGLGANALSNVTFDNATVSGHHWVGVAVGYNEFGAIDGVKVTNSSVTATCVATETNTAPCGDKAGSVVGFVGSNSSAKVKDCSAVNCTVKAGRDAGQVIGMAYPAVNTLTNNTATNVTVEASGTCREGNNNLNNSVIGRQ